MSSELYRNTQIELADMWDASAWHAAAATSRGGDQFAGRLWLARSIQLATLGCRYDYVNDVWLDQ